MTSRIEKLLKAYAEGKGGDIVDGEAPSRIEAILEEIIENRPFYEEEGAEVETVLMEKTLLELLEFNEGEEMGFVPNAFMEAGKGYTVTVNGVSRTYTAQSFDFEGMTGTYIGDDIRLIIGDGDVEPTEGFLYADLVDMGLALGSPTDEVIFAENFNIELTDYESFVNIMVKVSDMGKGVYVKQISGKFVEDMYYTEKVENPKVYVENLSVDTSGSYAIERIGFGNKGPRIVNIDGVDYECEVLNAAESDLMVTVIGNMTLFPIGEAVDVVDNGLPFIFANVASYPQATLCRFADSIEGTVTVTIRNPDEIVHKVPAKYLPPMEFNSKEIDARIAALENTVGELNDALENTLNGGS